MELLKLESCLVTSGVNGKQAVGTPHLPSLALFCKTEIINKQIINRAAGPQGGLMRAVNRRH